MPSDFSSSVFELGKDMVLNFKQFHDAMFIIELPYMGILAMVESVDFDGSSKYRAKPC